MDLKPGDCLLYGPVGFFGWVIATKTWHRIAHVEVYAGDGQSWASRDGVGFNKYPTRYAQLVQVLRPTVPLDLEKANAWAETKRGTKYGWVELLHFIGLTSLLGCPLSDGGMFCSQAEVEYYRHAGWNLFPEDDPADVAPFENIELVGAGFVEVAQ